MRVSSMIHSELLWVNRLYFFEIIISIEKNENKNGGGAIFIFCVIFKK